MRCLILFPALLPLARAPAYYRARYRSWDPCRWLRIEAAAIARQGAGWSLELLPGQGSMFDCAFDHSVQLVEPYHDSGRCLHGWARLRFLKPPVVQ